MSLSSVRAARELLGVAPSAGEQDLRRAFRHAARVAHPDSGGQVGDVAALHAAHDLLLDQTPACRSCEWAGRGLHPSPQAGHHSQAAVAASTTSWSRHQSKGPLIAMRTAHVGLFLGAIPGFALIVEGFGEMLIVALFAGLGWLIASVLAGTIDLGEVLSNAARSQRRSTVVMSAVRRDRPAPRVSDQRGPSPSRERGRLTVSDRAARHLVEGIAERGPLRVHDVDVRIDHLDDTGVSARVELAAEYPGVGAVHHARALPPPRRRRRRAVAGAADARLDLVVTDLVVSVEPARRVR